jgi:hypothetical protein
LLRGHGGGGGNGGLAGNGGNGANGCKVVIHTNDPSVLALFEVDVSAGEGGAPGSHGRPGQGGTGGAGGLPGRGGTYSEHRSQALVATKQAKPGHKGKPGKKGKNGRPPPSKQSKSGTSGSAGSVSFCVYSEAGMTESGGTPFRVLFNKKDLSKLAPLAINFAVPSTSPQEVFVYGQQLVYGPVLPINVGSISAPRSELLGFLVMHARHVLSTLCSAPFPRIPAENKTRYGELPPSAAQTLSMSVPKLHETGFALEAADGWPLSSQWSAPTACQATFRTLLSVDGIMQKYCAADGDNVSSKEYSITIDVPALLTPDQAGSGVLAPRSVLLSSKKATSFQAQFVLKSRLRHTPLDPQLCQVALLAAGSRVAPRLSLAAPDAAPLTVTTLPASASSGGYERVKALCNAPAVPPDASQTISFAVALPEQAAGARYEPGGSLVLRAELYFEQALVQHTPARSIRLCAAWPPDSPASPTDLLVLVDESFGSEDYGLLSSAACALGLKACFLDYQHFAGESSSGRLQPEVWAPQRGKATVLWLPTHPMLEQLVPKEDLAAHAEAGGCLLHGAASSFALGAERSKMLTGTHAFRRVVEVALPKGMGDLKLGLLLDQTQLAGAGFVALVLALIASFPTERKLQYLLDKGETLGKLLVGGMQADDYQAVIEPAGCCGCANKAAQAQVVPIRKTAVTLRDVLIAALRTDLMVDKQVFCLESALAHCVALESLLQFTDRHVFSAKSKTRGVALLARDVSAVLHASNVLDESSLAGGARVIFAAMALRLRVVAMRCDSIASDFQLDPKGMAQRTLDVDVVDEVRGRNGALLPAGNISFHVTMKAS